jgi:hypothetical protein
LDIAEYVGQQVAAPCGSMSELYPVSTLPFQNVPYGGESANPWPDAQLDQDASAKNKTARPSKLRAFMSPFLPHGYLDRNGNCPFLLTGHRLFSF